MQPYQQRVVEEKTELDNKLEKLGQFLEAETFSKLTEDEARRLNNQFVVMTNYSHILGERIAAF